MALTPPGGGGRIPGSLGLSPTTWGGRIPGPLGFKHVDVKGAATKATRKHNTDGEPVYAFQDLLQHLETLTRNRTHIAGAEF